MKFESCLQSLVAAALVTGGMLPVAQADVPAAPSVDVPLGTIVGIVTNAEKRPVAGATVTAIRAGGGIRATISGSNGLYSFADLPPGSWSLTAEAEGASEAIAPLEVVASKATRHDIVMNVRESTPAAGVAVAIWIMDSCHTPVNRTIGEQKARFVNDPVYIGPHQFHGSRRHRFGPLRFFPQHQYGFA